MLYVSIGILGATVMPHNLYLHSSIVQTRKYELTPEGRREQRYSKFRNFGHFLEKTAPPLEASLV